MSPFGGTIAIRAMKDGDSFAVPFIGTTEGLQAAIDYLQGGKGKVVVGPGTLDVTTVISIHSGCHLHGCGADKTVIRRATGSLTSGDAAYSGAMILSTAYGSNGTPNNSTSGGLPVAPQNDIEISELTLDGNQSNFGAVNPTTPTHRGIHIFFCEDVRVRSVFVKEFLMTGIESDACKNVILTDCQIKNCGQYASPSSRNAVTFNNNSSVGLSSGYAINHTMTNCITSNPKDSHVAIQNVKKVTVSNCQMLDGGIFGIEILGQSSITSLIGDFAFTNIVAKDLTQNFMRFGQATGVNLENVTLANSVCDFSSTLHNAEAMMLGRTNDCYIKSINVSGCTFRNINSAAASSGAAMVVLGNAGATASTRINISDCSFFGANGSANNASNRGMDIYGNISDLTLLNVRVYDCEGRAFYVHPATAGFTTTIVRMIDCLSDGAQGPGFVVSADAVATASHVTIENCTAKDTNKAASGAVFDLVASTNGSTLSAIKVLHSKCIRTSGTNMATGIRFFQSGTASLDDVDAFNNDFSGAATNRMSSSGAPTNVRVAFRPGRGTDIASAATIAIPQDGNVFHVTGAVNITNGITVNVWDNGRLVFLVFDSTPTVSDTGTSKLRAAFVATADDVLPLICDGTNWYQAAFESVN